MEDDTVYDTRNKYDGQAIGDPRINNTIDGTYIDPQNPRNHENRSLEETGS